MDIAKHPLRLIRWANDGYPPIDLMESFKDIKQLINNYSLMEKQNVKLKEINAELLKASNELLTAMEQHQFFMVGYKDGSVSISEVMDASQKEHAAYSKLWNIVKQEGL